MNISIEYVDRSRTLGKLGRTIGKFDVIFVFK